jgi:hypothetical protein
MFPTQPFPENPRVTPEISSLKNFLCPDSSLFAKNSSYSFSLRIKLFQKVIIVFLSCKFANVFHTYVYWNLFFLAYFPLELFN